MDELWTRGLWWCVIYQDVMLPLTMSPLSMMLPLTMSPLSMMLPLSMNIQVFACQPEGNAHASIHAHTYMHMHMYSTYTQTHTDTPACQGHGGSQGPRQSSWCLLLPEAARGHGYLHSSWLWIWSTGVLHVHKLLRLARTVYIHRIWPYNWWNPCKKYRIYTVYIHCIWPYNWWNPYKNTEYTPYIYGSGQP